MHLQNFTEEILKSAVTKVQTKATNSPETNNKKFKNKKLITTKTFSK